VTVRIAVFASGAGSNLEALVRHFGSGTSHRSSAGVVSLVVSNKPTAGALAIAARHQVPTSVLARPDDGAAVLDLLTRHDINLIALAGYLRRIPTDVTDTFRGRALNVHPALLPSFGGPGMYGSRVHRAVIEAGVRVTGATVHFVDAVYDHGPIIAQWPVPVRSDDSPMTVAERVLRVEHLLYPRVVEAVAAARVTLRPDGRVDSDIFGAANAGGFALDGQALATCSGAET
jgi:phosphoribosylglycinamide formyltransferase 1